MCLFKSITASTKKLLVSLAALDLIGGVFQSVTGRTDDYCGAVRGHVVEERPQLLI